MEEIFYGLKGIGEKETDFKFGSSSMLSDLLDEQEITYQPQYEYNQGAQTETRNWCTIYSSFTMLSYLKNKEFLLSDIQEVGHKMIADGKLDPDSGAYLSDAIDYVRKRWNSKNADKINSWQIDYTDQDIIKVLMDKSRLSQLGYYTSTELWGELENTGVALKSTYPKGGGHAITKYGLNLIDNYKGKKRHNRYSFDKFNELVKNGVVFKNGYIFLNA